MKYIYADTETTGTNHYINGIHQIALIAEIDGKVQGTLNLNVRPASRCKIEKEALAVSNVTLEDVKNYMPIEQGYKILVDFLGKFCDKFDKLDKFHLVGYNNSGFDNFFLRAFFMDNNDKFFNSWFWIDTIDVMVLASYVLKKRRASLPNFKLSTVAKELGVKIDESKLHDAGYDVELTRQLYKQISKK